jgi:NADH-quinone oxidoreductase subunit L
MFLLQAAQAAAEGAAGGAHPLSGTAAEWIWLVLLLPLVGAAVNGVLGMLTEWHPGPFDPDPIHTGEHAVPVAPTLVERAEHAAPRLMSVVEGHDVRTHQPTGQHPGVHHPPAHGEEEGDHGDHAEHGDDSHAPPQRHPFLGVVSIVAVSAMAAAFLLAVAIFFAMLGKHPETPFIARYWDWMTAGALDVGVTLQLDQLSMVMTLIITGVGTLIHLFSVGYMRDDGAYARYFAYLNLFVFFMLLLVLGGNYALMFVGWEGVGLCSFLLIGFWFTEKANADAGKKAFIVNRIGDFGFLIAMFLMFWNFKSLDFGAVSAAAAALPVGTAVATTIALFLFLGCTGKSAQLPLYVWLPDAMAGPTPVSALIHAATMVTAGVYLVARSSAIFAAAPAASLVVALVGSLTALFAALIGLKQWDIKKVLAYSTVSQLGYMFVAVGVGAYTAGIFHLATHAFFKALLFLGAGSVIHAVHHAYHAEGVDDDAQDMRNMGGLRKYMPITFATMGIATLAIAGVPPFAGFFSKDEILASAFARANGSLLAQTSLFGVSGSTWLYLFYGLGLLTALLTAVYMTRMMLYTFLGPNRTGGDLVRHHLHESGWTMAAPLVVLGVLSVVGGWLNLPALLPLGPTHLLDHWLEPVVGPATERIAAASPELPHATEYALVGAAVAIAVLGIVLAVVLLKPARLRPKAEAPEEQGIERVLRDKFYVDELYDRVIVRPTLATSDKLLYQGLDVGIIDRLLVTGFGQQLPKLLAMVGSRLQSGAVGSYAWVLLIGVIVVLGAFTFLEIPGR